MIPITAKRHVKRYKKRNNGMDADVDWKGGRVHPDIPGNPEDKRGPNLYINK
jgi:hypothetical protein